MGAPFVSPITATAVDATCTPEQMQIVRPSVKLGESSGFYLGAYTLDFLGADGGVLSTQQFEDVMSAKAFTDKICAPRNATKVKISLPASAAEDVTFASGAKSVEVAIQENSAPAEQVLNNVIKPAKHTSYLVNGSGFDLWGNGKDSNPTPEKFMAVTNPKDLQKTTPVEAEVAPGAAIDYAPLDAQYANLERKVYRNNTDWSWNFARDPFTNKWVRIGSGYTPRLANGVGLETMSLRSVLSQPHQFLNYIDVETGRVIYTRHYPSNVRPDLTQMQTAPARSPLHSGNTTKGVQGGVENAGLKPGETWDYIGRTTPAHGQTGVPSAEYQENIAKHLETLKAEGGNAAHLDKMIELVRSGHTYETFGAGRSVNVNWANAVSNYKNAALVTEEEREYYKDIRWNGKEDITPDPLATDHPTMLPELKAKPGDVAFDYYYFQRRGFLTVNYVVKTDNGAYNTIAPSYVSDFIKTGEAYDASTPEIKKPRIVTPDGKVYELTEEKGQTRDAASGVDSIPAAARDNTVTGTPSSEEKGIISAVGDNGKPLPNFNDQKTVPEVTYVYREVKSNVIVKYVDTDTKEEIKEPKVQVEGGVPDTEYDASGDDVKLKKITHGGFEYEFVKHDEKSAAEIGNVTEENQTVVYEYKKVTGSVVVKFVDEQGKPIGEKQKTVKEPGTSTLDSYNTATDEFRPATIEHEGFTYKLVKEDPRAEDGDAPALGNVIKGEQVVTYVYKKVVGSVTVKYVEEGTQKEIKPAQPSVEEGKPGDKYNTENLKEDLITHEGFDYKFVKKDPTSAAEDGEVTEGNQTVVYEYKKLTGSVVVKFVDEQGTPIGEQQKTVKPEGTSTREQYDTANETFRPATIEHDGFTYKLTVETPKADGAPANGPVKEGEQVVTYVYKKVVGSVTVKYVEEGTQNEIKPAQPSIEEGKPGDKYNTENLREDLITHEGFDYKFVKKDPASAAEDGEVTEGNQTVVYEYKKLTGSVVVKYEDEQGNPIGQQKTVKDPGTSTREQYDTATENFRPETIEHDGFTYTRVSTEPKPEGASAAGNVIEGEQVVTYVYKKVVGSVTVKYVDEDTKEEIKAVETPVEGAKPGTAYNTDTEQLKPATITDAKTGVIYEFVKKDPASAEAAGEVAEGNKEVVYEYKKVTGSVVVQYVDEEGKPIAEQKTVKEPGTLSGTDYDTTTEELKPETIDVDGVTYELVRKTPDSATATGKVVKGETVVVYEYKKVTGSVTVEYVDENGKPLKTPVVALPDGTAVGTVYDTTTEQFKPSTIVVDGVTYELVRKTDDSAAENGKLTKGAHKVTYVYRKVVKATTPPVTAQVKSVLARTGFQSGLALPGILALAAGAGALVLVNRKKRG